jgi:hypothetical protein
MMMICRVYPRHLTDDILSLMCKVRDPPSKQVQPGDTLNPTLLGRWSGHNHPAVIGAITCRARQEHIAGEVRPCVYSELVVLSPIVQAQREEVGGIRPSNRDPHPLPAIHQIARGLKGNTSLHGCAVGLQELCVISHKTMYGQVGVGEHTGWVVLRKLATANSAKTTSPGSLGCFRLLLEIGSALT